MNHQPNNSKDGWGDVAGAQVFLRLNNKRVANRIAASMTKYYGDYGDCTFYVLEWNSQISDRYEIRCERWFNSMSFDIACTYATACRNILKG